MTQRQGEMREFHPVEGEGYRYQLDETDGAITFRLEGNAPEGQDASVTLEIDARETGEGICRTETGRLFPFAWAWAGPPGGSGELHLWLDGNLYVFRQVDSSAAPGRRRSSASATETSGDILAPMPGAVLDVLVGEGDLVERNQTVAVMESMKMELLITAPRDGVVSRVSVRPGQQVERGMRLLELAPEA